MQIFSLSSDQSKKIIVQEVTTVTTTLCQFVNIAYSELALRVEKNDPIIINTWNGLLALSGKNQLSQNQSQSTADSCKVAAAVIKKETCDIGVQCELLEAALAPSKSPEQSVSKEFDYQSLKNWVPESGVYWADEPPIDLHEKPIASSTQKSLKQKPLNEFKVTPDSVFKPVTVRPVKEAHYARALLAGATAGKAATQKKSQNAYSSLDQAARNYIECNPRPAVSPWKESSQSCLITAPDPKELFKPKGLYINLFEKPKDGSLSIQEYWEKSAGCKNPLLYAAVKKELSSNVIRCFASSLKEKSDTQTVRYYLLKKFNEKKSHPQTKEISDKTTMTDATGFANYCADYFKITVSKFAEKIEHRNGKYRDFWNYAWERGAALKKGQATTKD